MRNGIRFLLTAFIPALLCTGLHAEDWQAKWITMEHCHGGTNTWLAFRKTVSLGSAPGSVTARIAADTKYWLWINGEMAVFEGGLKRGPAPGDSYYDTVEIGPYLKKGENDISLLVWYLGNTGFSHMSSGIPALLFDAEGDGVHIISDRSWKVARHLSYGSVPGFEPNFRLAESSIRFDAGLMPFDWFRQKGLWLGKAEQLGIEPGGAPFGKLVPRPVPLWKDYGLKEYESIERHADTIFCRLPYNAQITPWLEVDSPAGRLIEIRTDHDFVTGEKCLIAQYVTKDGLQSYESLGWLNGEVVRYIVPSDVKVKSLKYRESGYDCAFTGKFTCDDPFLNEYRRKAERTLYVCMRDTYYDCPDRERAQWWGDEVNELAEAFYALSPSSHRLARKGIGELIGWRRYDGSLFSPCPASNWSNELPMQILASVGWYGFRRYAFYSGDYGFVSEVYGPLRKYLHEVWKLDRNGLPVYRSGGWDWPDGTPDCDARALLPCWYALAVKAEVEFAEYLGKDEDALEDRELLRRMKESYNALYWNGRAYRTRGYGGPDDDRVQALAVLSGFADKSKYPAMREVLGREFHASTYMTAFVLEALFAIGEADMAIERIHKVFPSVMKDGCSTLYEHWNHSGTSNHAWSGCALTNLGQDVAGIKPLKPGFKEFTVIPQMGPLKKVDACVDSAAGLISVSLRRSGKRIKAHLTVPEGTTATVPCTGGKVRTFPQGEHDFIIQ